MKIEPCSNHSCLFRTEPLKGMGTNGPCHCVRDRPKEAERFIRQQRDMIESLKDSIEVLLNLPSSH